MNNRNNFKFFINLFLTTVFIGLSIINFIRIDSGSHSASDTLRPFILETAVLAAALIGASHYLFRKRKPSTGIK